MILCGDVGGSKTVLALYEEVGERLEKRRESVYASSEHEGLGSVLARFRSEAPLPRVRAACFGVAGPVIDGRVEATNLPWVIDAAELAGALDLERVGLLNDLEATAYGMLELSPQQCCALNPRARTGRQGHAAVIAAGTGLGQATLFWDGRRHRALASEGGHADFAPRSEEQIELLRFLRAELGRVSIERVLSGPGLHNLYRFLRSRSADAEPGWLTERLAAEDPGAVIGEVGVEGAEPVCAASVELFASIYGAEAGDMALRCLAFGGVFVGGGIAPRLLPVLRSGAFMDAFGAKGRFSDLVASFDVRVSLEPRAALLGAARHGARSAEG